jgi:hypothetical protein
MSLKTGGQCPPYDWMELVEWALPTQLDVILEFGIAGQSVSNSKFKGHSTGNGWFIANPHPEIKFPG